MTTDLYLAPSWVDRVMSAYGPSASERRSQLLCSAEATSYQSRMVSFNMGKQVVQASTLIHPGTAPRGSSPRLSRRSCGSSQGEDHLGAVAECFKVGAWDKSSLMLSKTGRQLRFSELVISRGGDREGGAGGEGGGGRMYS